MKKNPISKYSQSITIDDNTAPFPCIPAQAFSKYGEAKVRNYIYKRMLTFPYMPYLIDRPLRNMGVLVKVENSNSFKRLVVCVLSVHYGDVIMGAIASQITSLAIVYSTVYSGVDQRKL